MRGNKFLALLFISSVSLFAQTDITQSATITTNVTNWFSGGTSANLARIRDGNTSTSGSDNYQVHPRNANGLNITFSWTEIYDNGSFVFYNRTNNCCDDRIIGSTVNFILDGNTQESITISSGDNVITVTPNVSTVFDEIQLVFSGDSQNFREIEVFAEETSLVSNGPGGIGKTNGNDFYLWLKPDAGVTLNGSNVSSWADQSGYLHNGSDAFSLSEATNQPLFGNAQINGIDVVTFDGVNDQLAFDLDNITDSDYSVIVVWKNNEGGDEFDGVFSTAASAAAGSFEIGYSNNTTNVTINGDGTEFSLDGSETFSLQNHILQMDRKSGNSISTYINGNTDFSNSVIGASVFNLFNEFRLGVDLAGADFLGADVAEIIITQSSLTDVQRILLNNYLSAKYNLTIANDFYNGDTNGNGDFDFDIAGIGATASDGSSNRSISSSIVDILEPSSLDNGDYLIIGHNNESIATGQQEATNVSGNIVNRLKRIWYVDKTNDVGTVTVNIDISNSLNSDVFVASDLKLITDADGDFSSGIVEIDCDSYDSNTGIATFENVNFTDNHKFTLGNTNGLVPLNTLTTVAGGKGPGGVGTTDGSSSVEFWMKGDNGFIELSGNGLVVSNEGTTRTGTSATLNGQETFVFDGSSALCSNGKRGGGNYIETDLDISPTVIPEITIISVYKPDVDDAGAIWGGDDGNWDRFMLDTDCATSINSAVSTGPNNSPTTVNNINNLFVPNVGSISTVVYDEDEANGSFVYVNGKQEANFTANNLTGGNTTTFDLEVGALGKDDFNFDGEIAEIVILSEINKNQQIIIENYLSAKYNVPLSENDFYAGDGVSMVDNGGNTVEYDFDVTGIGATASDSSLQQLSQGTGIVEIKNPSDLQFGEYLFIGHNNIAFTSNETDDITANIQQRFERTWYVDETGDVGTVTLTFDLSFSPTKGTLSSDLLYLLVDDDGNFDNSPDEGAVATEIACTSYNQATGLAVFENVSLADANRITLGIDSDTISISPAKAEGNDGPGGIGTTDGTSNLELWVHGQNPFTDLSGNNAAVNNFGDVSTTDQDLNGLDVYTFDGGNDLISTTLSINESVFPDLTIFSVYKPNTNNAGGVWGENDGSFDRYLLDTNDGGLNEGVSNGSSHETFSGTFPVGAPTLTTVVFDEDETNLSEVFLNGESQGTFTSNHTGDSSSFNIGTSGDDSESNSFDGDIAEVIVISQINEVNRVITENYLASKYGLTLGGGANDIFAHDTNGAGDFDYNLAAIGQDSNGNSNASAAGTAKIIISNPSDLDNGEYMAWASNANEITFTTDTSRSFVQASTAFRVDITGGDGVGTVKVAFNLSDLGLGSLSFDCLALKLVQSSSADFSSATETAFTIDNGVAEIENYTFTDDNYFRIEYAGSIVYDGGSWTHPDVARAGTPAPNDTDECYAVFVDVNETVTITADVKVESMEVSDGAKVIVATGVSLTIINEIDLNTTGELRMLGTSQLLQDHTGVTSNTGSGFYNQIIAPTKNIYSYSYFSSPVNSNGTTFTLGGSENNMLDGTTPLSSTDSGLAINYLDDFRANQSTSPITIAGDWINTYFNNGGFIRNSGTASISIGHGFTMKAPGSNAQTYIFNGAPNDGDYNLTLTTNTYSLIGNPYPSALDADEFIEDNLNTITGDLYFYEQNGGTSHFTTDYEAGYGVYNKAGQVAASTGLNGENLSSIGGYTAPTRFIPVGQAFFVQADADNGGTLTFRNSQRSFKVRGGESIFFKQKLPAFAQAQEEVSENYIQLGIEFDLDEDNVFHRQLGISFKSGNSDDYDKGYDAHLFDEKPSDAYVDILGHKYVLGSVGSATPSSKVPVTINLDVPKTVKFMIDEIKNPNQKLYLHDNNDDSYEDLDSEVIKEVSGGLTSGRFEVVTSKTNVTLSGDKNQRLSSSAIVYEKSNNSFQVFTNESITSLQVFDVQGKLHGESKGSDTVLINTDLDNNFVIVKIATQSRTYTVKKFLD